MRYGYESNWFGEGALHTKVMDVARRLLVNLRRHRKVGGTTSSNICTHQPQEWPEIFDWTTGLVFLSTPFRGAPGMNQVEMLEAARLKYSNEHIQEETLRIFQSGNETLLNLVNEFCQVRRNTTVMCFYERKPTSVGKIFGRQDITVSDSKGSYGTA
ncbi:MAG: hypothetical protein Q9225_004472 [Loekoesia sp. 1 TL-2023]